MKFLIVDRDRMAVQHLQHELESNGYEVVVEPTKNAAMDRLSQEDFSALFIDPSPLNDIRPIVLGVQRATQGRVSPYIFMLKQASNQDQEKGGVNDFIDKPYNKDEIEKKLINAERMNALKKHFSDPSQDTGNSPTMMGKMAFNQVFESALDRADRYGEAATLILFQVDGVQELIEEEGIPAIEHVNNIFGKRLGGLRRKSDLIGYIASCEYAFLIQRPKFDSEPLAAANRFHETFSMFEDFTTPSGKPFNIKISVISLPTGEMLQESLAMPKIAA